MNEQEMPILEKFEWGIGEDGKTIRVVFLARTGEKIAAYLDAEQLTGLIGALVDIGASSGEKFAPPDEPKRRVRAKPIPISQMGIGPSPDPTEAVLSMRTGLLEFLFSVDAHTLLQTLKKLEAVSRPNDSIGRA